MRRFKQLTNAFSKKLENHGHMVALYFMRLQLPPSPEDATGDASDEGGIDRPRWSTEELITRCGVVAGRIQSQAGADSF
jgi:hypothetical protein